MVRSDSTQGIVGASCRKGIVRFHRNFYFSEATTSTAQPHRTVPTTNYRSKLQAVGRGRVYPRLPGRPARWTGKLGCARGLGRSHSGQRLLAADRLERHARNHARDCCCAGRLRVAGNGGSVRFRRRDPHIAISKGGGKAERRTLQLRCTSPQHPIDACPTKTSGVCLTRADRPARGVG